MSRVTSVTVYLYRRPSGVQRSADANRRRALYVMVTDELAVWHTSSSVEIELGPKSRRPSACQASRCRSQSTNAACGPYYRSRKQHRIRGDTRSFNDVIPDGRPRCGLCDLLRPWIIGATQWSAPYNVSIIRSDRDVCFCDCESYAWNGRHRRDADSGPAATSVFAMLAITANPASPIAVLPPPTVLAFFPRRPSLVFRQDRLIVELAHRALEAQTPPRIAA